MRTGLLHIARSLKRHCLRTTAPLPCNEQCLTEGKIDAHLTCQELSGQSCYRFWQFTDLSIQDLG